MRYVSLIILLVSGSVLAEIPEKIRAERDKQEQLILRLADSLLAEGRSDEAYVIYADFADTFPASPERLRAIESQIGILERKQKFSQALELHLAIYADLGPTPRGIQHLLAAGRLHERIGEEEHAVEIYRTVSALPTDPGLVTFARNRLALIELMPLP